MPGHKVTLNCADLRLEGFLDLPAGAPPWAGVVLCHPHSLYGGNMDNNVILTVSQALVAGGLAALRFNFRGVGRSQGSFGGGDGEREDAVAALSFLADYAGMDAQKIGIFGYSFGGMVALATGVQNDLVKALAAVSPVTSPGLLEKCLKPLLLVYGTKDEVVSPAKIIAEAGEMTRSPLMAAVAGADHFFWGYEGEVAEKVSAYFIQQLQPGRG